MAPKRLGEQRARGAGMVQGRGMELEELHVGDGCAGPQSHGHAVTGCSRRIGGHREDLAGTAGRQEHVAGTHFVGRAVAGQA